MGCDEDGFDFGLEGRKRGGSGFQGYVLGKFAPQKKRRRDAVDTAFGGAKESIRRQ